MEWAAANVIGTAPMQRHARTFDQTDETDLFTQTLDVFIKHSDQ